MITVSPSHTFGFMNLKSIAFMNIGQKMILGKEDG